MCVYYPTTLPQRKWEPEARALSAGLRKARRRLFFRCKNAADGDAMDPEQTLGDLCRGLKMTRG